VVLRQLHYHSDAEGLVLVLDSNGSPPHRPEHEAPQGRDPKCRLCNLRNIIDDVFAKVRPRPLLPTLKVAVGLAVPAIEAWLLCGDDPHVTEAAWINGLKERRGRMPYTEGDLKRRLYGTTHPSLAIATEKMQAAATRLCQNLAHLESLFPHGFGALLKNLRSW
jgi:hypothetical protein